MTDRACSAPATTRSVFEPARVPGYGGVPAPVARAWLRDAGDGSVWLRRLYTSPGGRDLVAMDSRRRVFGGLLRRMLVLRDDVCCTPWCGAPIVHADHTTAVREGGATAWGNGGGTCARCNQVKEAPGWRVTVIHPGTGSQHDRHRRGRRERACRASGDPPRALALAPDAIGGERGTGRGRSRCAPRPGTPTAARRHR